MSPSKQLLNLVSAPSNLVLYLPSYPHFQEAHEDRMGVVVDTTYTFFWECNTTVVVSLVQILVKALVKIVFIGTVPIARALMRVQKYRTTILLHVKKIKLFLIATRSRSFAWVIIVHSKSNHHQILWITRWIVNKNTFLVGLYLWRFLVIQVRLSGSWVMTTELLSC